MLRMVMPMVVAIALIAPMAMAEETKNSCPRRPANRELARDLAGDYFKSAERAFNKELFNEALAKFLCSLRLVEHENTVFNIAHVTTFVTDKEAALHLFYSYIEDYPDGKATEEIRRIIVELEERPAKDRAVKQYPPSAGTSTMEDASSYSTDELALSYAAKESSKMSRVVEISTWTSFGVGGASLFIAVILQGIAISAKNKAEDATTYDDFAEAKDQWYRRQAGAIAMFIAAGIFGGAGATLVLWDKGLLEGKKKSKVALSLVPLPSGVVLEGRF
jgi:hypothetical protein